jgi:tight adherence protein C
MSTTLNMVRSYLAGEPLAALFFVLLIAVAAFVMSMGASAVLLALADPLRRRLGRVGARDYRPAPTATDIAELLRPLFPYLVPRKEGERSRVGRLLMHAGYRSPSALPLYYACKAALMITLPLLVLLASAFIPKVTGGKLLFAALAASFLGSLILSMWLDHRVSTRQRELRVAFPDALDLLVVCVEAGLGLAPALQRVADDLAVSHPELGTELALVNAEIRAGVDRAQALKNLAERTGLDDIRGLVTLLVQTMRFGTGVADALRVYSEEFRDKRMQAAEEVAAKIGTKMIFPLTLCLFPSFFLITIGPAVMRIVVVFKQMHH